MRISSGILAGSHREGFNNAQIRITCRKTTEKLMTELSPLGDVVISASVKKDYEDLCSKVAEDTSMAQGLVNVIAMAEEKLVFVCGSDMPSVTRELVIYLAGFLDDAADCVCLSDGKHVQPLCAIYSKKALPVIEKAVKQGTMRLTEILGLLDVRYIDIRDTILDSRVTRNLITRRPERNVQPQAVFCVSGPKNSGKTGLIVRLINEFINEGYSVGAIKHDGHDFVIDTAGTDTFRFMEAGACGTAVFSEDKAEFHFMRKFSSGEVTDAFPDLDILIIEGMKSSSYPKVEMTKKDGDTIPCDPQNLICRATDHRSPIKDQIPVFDRNDTKGIFLCIKKYFGLEH